MGALGSPSNADVIIEILPGRLTFWASRAAPAPGVTREADGFHFFSLGESFAYQPFASDFGPFKLSVVYRYCVMLHEKLCSPTLAHMNIVHYCSLGKNDVANAACLVCMYQVIARGICAEEAFEPFRSAGVKFRPFCDALSRDSFFDITILDCLRGMERSIDLGWFDWRNFDVNNYDALDSFDIYGMNWLIPGKLLAFASPRAPSDVVTTPCGPSAFVPEDYVRVFREANISLVIRLNSKEYDEEEFISNGIEHLDLFFADGSCPSPDIISAFFTAVDSAPGAVAVHCKAGLGRTGTLIGLYAMRNYFFSAREFIAWSRICRPGSVLGNQQHFLSDMEAIISRDDCMDRMASFYATPGDEGQGERLCQARLVAKSLVGVSAKEAEAYSFFGLPVLLGRPGSGETLAGHDFDQD